MQLVISQRQVGGQFEGRLADRSAIEIIRGPVVFELPQADADRPVLQPEPQARGIAVGDVHPERRRDAGPADDGRRQRPGPVVAVVCAKRGGALALGRSGHTEGIEHGDQRRIGDGRVPAGPVLVFGCHTVTAGQLDE
jgi:hypothetical protein